MNNYTVLHCHSMLSNGVTNIDSITKYIDYINKAKELGMTALAISEHGSCFEWYHKKVDMEKAGLKYIHAEEFYVTETLSEKIRDNYHCLLIAKNYDGFCELNSLSSKSFNREDNSFYYVPRISYDDLKNTSDNIIICTACLAGILSKGSTELKNDFFNFILEHKDRCFFELQPHLDNNQIIYNQQLYNIANEYGINCVMCTDTHALNAEHVRGRSILQKAKGIHFENEDNFHLEFLSYEELIDLCKQQNAIPLDGYLKAIEQTNIIADMIETWDIDYSYKYPHLWGDNSEQILRDKISQGIINRGVDKYLNYQEYLDRIEYEMKAYIHNGAIDFMLLMEDIVSWCRTQDIQIGYGRGSVNGSVIAWLLGITEMDSIKHKLNFDRFMNVSRVSLSDVDTDFPPNRINEVKEYIFNKHGLYCADIITFNTIALKGAIRDVARALQIPLDIVDDICNNVETKEEQLRKEYPELFEYVDLVNGTIVSVGSHPCFTADALVFTDTGYKKISDITTNDKVLTHNNTFKKVIKTMVNENNNICSLKIPTIPFKTTYNHPFYVRELKKIRLREYKDGIDTNIKKYSMPIWKNAIDIKKGDVVGFPVNTNSIIPIHNELNMNFYDNNLWWIIGRYLGDGWITDNTRGDSYLTICCNKKDKYEKGDIVKRLILLGYKYRIVEEKTIYKIIINNKDLKTYLRNFGKYANGKYIYNEIFDLPIEQLRNLLIGYLSADGTYTKETNEYSYKTISKKLALGFTQIVAKVYNVPTKISKTKGSYEYIQGRLCKTQDKYNCVFHIDQRRNDIHFYENGYIWYHCWGIETYDEKQEVYNLSIEDDNSYMVNNIIVHNCGLIVSPNSITDRVGLFTTSTDVVPISQINMKEIDAQNYVKLDLLKLDTIELINETCKLANIERLTPDNMDITDNNVWESMRDDTTQIFQWEGETGANYISKLLSDDNITKFQEINDNVDKMTLLSIGNSAIRPAGASYREDLANGIVRKSGSKAIDDFLAPTFGYLVFQCQIIEFLHEYCGFTMGEADVVRRHFAKKYGTDKDIPVIKNGGYISDEKDHYIDGFIETMKKKYNMSKDEAEKTITYFLQVIEDASNYLFSLNHSQPYSYEGYASAWLRYYYPLEFLTVALNINKDNEVKTYNLIKYAHKRGITIKSPLFRHSKAEYFYDKEHNYIYKGIGSIKYMNDKIAEELFSFKDNHYNNFIDLLTDIKNKTTLNKRQLDILIKIDFFQEFGNINQLLAITECYNIFYNCKTLKKDRCEKLNLNFDIIRKCCEKETDKTFSGIKGLELVKELCETINLSTPIIEKIAYQIGYNGFTDLIDDTCNDNLYVISDLIQNQYGTTFCTIYQPNTGESYQYKIKRSAFNTNPCHIGDIIKAVFNTQHKRKKNENDEWVQSEEQEEILKNYTIVKKFE